MTVPERADAAGHAEGEIFDPAPHRPTRRGLTRLAIGAAVVTAGLVAAGVVPRVLHTSAMAEAERAAATQTPVVRAARAERAAAPANLALPGTVQALQETAIYARANGYVRTWFVDIGARVKQGQILAELDMPDVDEELRQAVAAAAQSRAGIDQAKTQLELARTTNARYARLGPSGVVSEQELAQYAASLEAQKANLSAVQAAYNSAEANVRRLQDIKGFGRLTAPFAGVVTMRAAEIGQLVVAGTGAGQPLFRIAQDDTVRVFVNVPQLYAAGVAPGMPAPVTVRELPGEVFGGHVARTSNQLDVSSRTLLTEIDIPNPDRALITGMYARVAFEIARQDRPLLVPSTAVLFDARGSRVAAVDDGIVRWKSVAVDGDFGDRIAISTGLSDGETVAVTPSEQLVEGTRVRVDAAK